MPTVIYTASDFPANFGPNFSGTQKLPITWAELLGAAITVGRASWQDVIQYGTYSAYEMLYRAALVWANLRETSDQFITRSAAYDGLDGSEKGAVSYFIGLTLAKHFAAACLGVPWLMHFDVYRDQFPAVLQGNSRPDLLGLGPQGDWVIVEAKGRTGKLDSIVLSKAKRQSQQPLTIKGETPGLRVGAVAHFGTGKLSLAVVDPDSGDSRSGDADLEISREAFRQRYYRPILDFLRHANVHESRIDGVVFSVADLPELDLSVGLRADLIRMIPKAVTLGTVVDGMRHPNIANTFVGGDGVLVRLGRLWSTENMVRDPRNRIQ